MTNADAVNRNTIPGVSTIICSYNGGEKLIPTLEHIAAQNLPKDCLVEIIYVDNASSDNSLEIVRHTWNRIGSSHIPIRILQEKKAGKYFALKKAISHASYNYFIICDDDNWLSPDYVQKVRTILDQDEHIGAVGGRSIAVFEDFAESVVPNWFDGEKQRYAIGQQGERSGDVSKRKQLWGAGMASRTAIYRIFYDAYPSLFLSPEEGDNGHFVAEDTEYCLRLLLRGYKLFYDDSLVLRHFVSKERLSLAYNKKLKERIESSFDIIERYNLATKLYGKIAYSTLNIFRLKLLTPILLLVAKKRKRRNQLLKKLLFPAKSEKDPMIEQIRLFATDPDLPRPISK